MFSYEVQDEALVLCDPQHQVRHLLQGNKVRLQAFKRVFCGSLKRLGAVVEIKHKFLVRALFEVIFVADA